MAGCQTQPIGSAVKILLCLGGVYTFIDGCSTTFSLSMSQLQDIRAVDRNMLGWLKYGMGRPLRVGWDVHVLYLPLAVCSEIAFSKNNCY
jgi:hypothetical protein